MANFIIKKYDDRSLIMFNPKKKVLEYYFYTPITMEWENLSGWVSLKSYKNHKANDFQKNYRFVTKKYLNR
jgi:hypothetical protein